MRNHIRENIEHSLERKLDPFKETADIDENNNSWPKVKSESRFDLYKTKVTTKYENKEQNPMQKKLSEKK